MSDNENLTLEELAAAYRAGNAFALDRIVERCSYLVRRVSRKYFLNNSILIINYYFITY